MKKIISALLIIIISVVFVLPVSAYGGTDCLKTSGTNTLTTNVAGQIEIYDYEDLLSIKDNPSGSFILMTDIDLKGKEWTPVDFTGTFDGNGYAILNGEITDISRSSRITKDGNMLTYDTYFAGFFGVVETAVISNLKLLGLEISVESDVPTFIGGIAGFMEESEISGCTVEGRLTLKTSGANWGIGGFLGFGNGSIRDSEASVTLIGVDTDSANKDEQFMGGAYAAGYADLINDTVSIQGYCSEHGYAHNGGLVGMYELYYPAIEYYGEISCNLVSGHITFYEDNDDPRAYCEPYIGEIMTWCFSYEDNGEDFTPNNVTEENRENGFTETLMPHTCINPVYADNVINGTCTDYGYTDHVCELCGYEYKSDYTALSHSVKDWITVSEASGLESRLEQGVCEICGATVYRSVSLEKETTVEAELNDNTYTENNMNRAETTTDSKSGSVSTIVIIIIILAAIALVFLFIFIAANRRRRRRKRRIDRGRRRR